MRESDKRNGKDELGHVLVSIIIPTRNSSKTIERCLKSIKKQTWENVEIIISDNFSKDDTVNIARKYGARVILRGHERAAQKNHGASIARGDMLYFIDSDFVLAGDAVKRCVHAIKEADALVTSNFSVGRSFWARAISYKRQLLSNDPTVYAARFIKKDVFFKVDGFYEELVYGEDTDLHRRLLNSGFNIKKVNAIEWHIGEPETLREFAYKEFYYGKVLKRYLRRDTKVLFTHLNPFKLKLMKGILRKPSLLAVGLGIIQMMTYVAILLGLITAVKD